MKRRAKEDKKKYDKIKDKYGQVKFYEGEEGFDGYMFSNFSMHPVKAFGVVFKTSEHLFQALKFKDENNEIYDQIVKSDTPGEAKNLAALYKHERRKDWSEVKDDVMLWAIQLKVDQNEDVRKALSETGEKYLVENSKDDYYWGCGKDGTGRN
jgi:N-glycosidase YbiA